MLGLGTDDGIAQCLGGHDDVTTLIIGQIDGFVVGYGLCDSLGYALGVVSGTPREGVSS